MTRRVALITGASAGIGAAFARLYAVKAFDLVLVARRLDRLEALGQELSQDHGVHSFPIRADLSEPGAADLILNQVAAKGREVDVLVNNAGYGLPGAWTTTKWNDQARVLQVMLTAPLELTHKVLPSMAASRWGRIVNIASLAGFSPGSRGHTTYSAIKSALIKFSQSVHVEMAGTGVHCTAVCPGLTYSEFHDVNGAREQLKQLPGFLWQTAEAVAKAGYRASERNQSIQVTGALNKTLAGVLKVMPDALALQLTKGAGGYRNLGSNKPV